MNRLNELVTICIPTWNRMNILEESLENLIPKIEPYGFRILISDNASNDGTETVVRKYQERYQYIHYNVHDENIGPDRNFEWVLKEAAKDTEYAWILGDSYRIIDSQLQSVVNILEKRKYSLVVVNGFDRICEKNSKEYKSMPVLFDEIGWHMTMIGALIFSKKIIEHDTFYRYFDTNFIQEGIVFEFLSKNPLEKVYFYAENTIYATQLSRDGNHWISESIKVFGKNWMSFVLSLPPEIPLSTKFRVIKWHNVKIDLFNIDNFFRFRKLGWFDYEKDVKPYQFFIPFVSLFSRRRVVFLSKYPYKIVRPFKRYFKKKEKEKLYEYLIKEERSFN